MLQHLTRKFRRTRSSEAEPYSSPQPYPRQLTHADTLEVMPYGRGMDIMPFVIGFRTKPRFAGPSGSEPLFMLLESETDVEAFFAVLARPVEFGDEHVVEFGRWNVASRSRSEGPSLMAFYYPEDTTQGWPFAQVFAYPPDIFPELAISDGQTRRGRYDLRLFPPKDMNKYVRKWLKSRAGKPEAVFVG